MARNRTRATICHHLFQFSTLCKGTWYSNGNCSSGSAACIQLEICALSAGCSLLISPGRCLGLEPKWHCHFGIPKQRTHLYYVSILMMGCLWGFAGVDILRTSTKNTQMSAHARALKIRKRRRPGNQRFAKSGEIGHGSFALLVAPYCAILRYYRCDTPYRAILFKGSQHSPKIVRYPPPCYLVSHRHICAIPHFATYRAITVR